MTRWNLWDEQDRLYHVTGVDVYGRRFKRIATSNRIHALSINLYRGTVWEVDKETGKRKVMVQVWN